MENETKVVKYYCPLEVVLDRRSGWGEDREELNASEILEYSDEIERFVENYDDGDLASYFDGPMTNKLISATWGVEIIGCTLYGCITVTLNAPLTAEEEECLKDEIEGQNSDGFGESLEQQGIKVDDGELYVSFWQSGKDYFLCNERELMKRLNFKQPYKFHHETAEFCRELWENSTDNNTVAMLEFDCVDVRLSFEGVGSGRLIELVVYRNDDDTGWRIEDYIDCDAHYAIHCAKSWNEIENFMYKALVMYCEQAEIDYTQMLWPNTPHNNSSKKEPTPTEIAPTKTKNSTTNVFEPGRMMTILRNALIAYEFELEGQGYGSQGAMHEVVRNEFGISEEEYRAIKGLPFEEIKLRQISAEICDLFEELLDAHDITIPDEDRSGEEGEARIYGSTYSDLEDEITQILSTLCHEVKTTPGAVINVEDY